MFSKTVGVLVGHAIPVIDQKPPTAEASNKKSAFFSQGFEIS